MASLEKGHKMKKLGIFLGVFFVTNVFADYQLSLIDKDGTTTIQCIKSYSFSNNLESVIRKKVEIDEYSTVKETLTNKIYDGKPVYRRVWPLADFTAPYSVTIDKYSPKIDNIDTLLKNDFTAEINGVIYTPSTSVYVIYTTGKAQVVLVNFVKSKKQARLTIKQNHGTYKGDWHVRNFRFILEYTKTTDKANFSSNSFKSYLHYVPSSSDNEEVITINLKNKGIKLLENYVYDDSLDSCLVDNQ